MSLKTIITTFLLLATLSTASGKSVPVYIGTYTEGQNAGQGIYASRLDLNSGALSFPVLAVEIPNPTFLALHPNGKILYSVSETGGSGFVTAFEILADTLILKPINRLSSCGSGPCHISVDRRGENVFVANYGGGSIAVIPMAADGSLAGLSACIKHSGKSRHPQRQKKPHPHSVNISPDSRFAYVADLGIDKIMIYRIDPTQDNLARNSPPYVKLTPGAGPRHFCFHPNAKFAYIINELDNTVAAFDLDSKTGALKENQSVSTLPSGFEGANTAAHIAVHPNGKFLYASNRGYNSIAVYRIDPDNGTLTLLEFQRDTINIPRNFAIEPTGQFCLVANRGNNSVSVLRIHPDTGALEPTGHVIDVPQAVFVKVLPKDL